ncbi:CD225/dispanin family protein [Porphyromonas circumdentaria]|uniref:CD225/dispanin family protein n=1 Tax=Porphyromonas circumdentaria TaxID=29524 RepID=UPI0026DC4604|nr:CD225/dispanin family protein [Porphyromonas circumdentaria]MDO4722556.1 CD225/dispanin family protein [Porphyromonas circumdentaria]
MDKLYYSIINGMQQGPFTLEELLKRGITRDTPLWTEGMVDWLPASGIPEVARHLTYRQTPPPSYEAQIRYGEITNEDRGVCPPTYLVWSVLMTLFCCWFLGIFAIINSAGVQSAYRRGDYELAQRKSKTALTLTIIGAIVGFVFSVIYFIFFFIVGASNALFDTLSTF